MAWAPPADNSAGLTRDIPHTYRVFLSYSFLPLDRLEGYPLTFAIQDIRPGPSPGYGQYGSAHPRITRRSSFVATLDLCVIPPVGVLGVPYPGDSRSIRLAFHGLSFKIIPWTCVLRRIWMNGSMDECNGQTFTARSQYKSMNKRSLDEGNKYDICRW